MLICPLSPVSMLIFTSSPSWLCYTDTFQLAPLLYMLFPYLMLTFPLHTSKLLQFNAAFKHIEDDADYRSRLTIYAWHPQTSLSPGSTNLQLKFWRSVELNFSCVFTSYPLSLAHYYRSNFCWFGSRSYLLPQAAQSFPIISSRPNSHFFNLPPVDGGCAHRRCQLPSRSFY